MAEAHRTSGALVTLAVMERDSARTVCFDAEGFFGHANRDTGQRVAVRTPVGPVLELPFCGVHVASATLLDRITETGRFGIFTTYLRLAAEGATIAPYRVDGSTWIDIGRPETLARARAAFDEGALN